MVNSDGWLAGKTTRIFTGTDAEREWYLSMDAWLTVRSTGWYRYLCLPASSIVSQEST